MAAEVEQRDVAGRGLAQVAAEPADDCRPRRRLVVQRVHEQRVGVHATLQQRFDRADVVNATVQRRDSGVLVDADEQRKNAGHETSCERQGETAR